MPAYPIDASLSDTLSANSVTSVTDSAPGAVFVSGLIHTPAMQRLAVLLLVGLVVPGNIPSRAESDPEICVEAIAQDPEHEIRALRAAERSRWRVIRKAGREGRKLMRGSLGMGPGERSRVLARELDEIGARHRQAMGEARELCECRARRKDPDGANCERLYPRMGPG